MTALRLVEARWAERPVRMRLPFQFGSTEVRETAEAHASVTIEVGGKRETGRSAQLMVPRWFDKRASMSNADTIDELRTTVRTAVEKAPGLTGPAVAVSRDLRAEVAAALPDVPGLAAGFGPALLEMAVIDALCSAAKVPFWRAARDDLFGLAKDLPSDLNAEALSTSLSRIEAPRRISLRHTIGFDAPLRGQDVSAEARPDDLPVALDEVIARTGISGFKIKLKGDPAADLARLRDISGIVGGLPGLTVTLDANEQYATDAFAAFLDGLEKDAALAPIRAATRFVEQPFPRETALTERVSPPLPLIIDESDDSEEAFPRALELGWSGTSIKSCKGVLRALLNKARAEAAGAVLSGEDLTCQPGLCWQQDTAMMSACGVRDVERNGHHFAGGLQSTSPEERRHFAEAHPDIYLVANDATGLRIQEGAIDIQSLGVSGFGCETINLPPLT
ncbi:enolase-like domain-containing protein [Histidinibacterium aquaticum]|nr:enolase C-terminal domain-like protein [Histidinibacterium aquaticum]